MFMHKVRRLVLALVASASLLGGCSGGHSTLPATPLTTSGYSGPLAAAAFKITIPRPPESSRSRRPDYVSSSTAKIVFTLNTASNLTSAQVTSVNTNDLGAKAITLGGAQCPGSGPWTCTITIELPPGSDNLTMSAQDSSSNILSQQIQTFAVVAGMANSFSVTFDANASSMTVSTSSGFCAGSFNVAANQTVPTVGTTAVTFSATYQDPASKPIVGPGLPLLNVNGHTDDNGGAGYTITGTGGNVTVKVTQATQTYTLAATTSSTSATINVSATPKNTAGSSDGLSFNKTLTFTFQSGAAPPSGLLAAVEQTNTTPGNSSGQVDLFTMTNPSDPTAFNVASPATLAPTGGPPKDVDNPQDMVFDTNGDLLLANGGAGNPDFGNFACIPAGAITTGANAATILTSHLDDPVSLALGGDSSVALANIAPAPPYSLVEYLLSGTYSEAPTSREVSYSQAGNEGALNVVALPASAANPSGTFAAGFSSGANPPLGSPCNPNNGSDPAGNSSQVILKRPDGSTGTINDSNNTVVEPLVGYDAHNGVLVIAASGACNAPSSATGSTAFLDMWTVDAVPVKRGSQMIYDAGGSPDSSNFTIPGGGAGGGLAVSSSGYIAIGGSTGAGPEVQVFTPTVSGTAPNQTRATDGAPIPFDATTTSGGSTYAYGTPGKTFVTSLRFLGSSNKLLIGFHSDKASLQGFYLYDVANLSVPSNPRSGQPCTNTTCFDEFGNPVGSGPTLVAFQATTNHPLASAYHP